MTTLPEMLAADLTKDGDTVECDGVTYRLRVEPDMGRTTISDFECYGRTERYSHDYRDMRTSRPDDMDGNAEKLDFGDGWIWWQPPSAKCGPQREEPGFSEMRERVGDILRWGFDVLVLELLEGEDAHGVPIVRAVASVGCVEPMPSPQYVAGLVADLAWEIQHQGVNA